MTNIQIKKEILNQIKFIKDDYEINIYLYEGQGGDYEEAIWLDISIKTENELISIDLNDIEYENIEKNKKYLKSKQDKIFNYLSKYFKTNKIETNI